MLLIVFYCFVAVTAINVCYYFSFYSFLFAKPNSHLQAKVTTPISVIICAKNEGENLRENLPKILAQKYSEFELILINDASYDDTLEVMENFQLRDSRIVVVNVQSNERFWGNKKYALTLGIKKANYEKLVFTDADCYPASENWLAEMANGFQPEKSIVLGYGAYQTEKSFLNKLIRFETLLTALQYFSSAKRGRAYMGVGRNLAYTSDEFYENKGFVSHMSILSGDDDLFINQIATKKNTSIVYTPDSFTFSKAKSNWKSWFAQKRRHVSTAKFYKKKHQLKLGLFYVSQLSFWCLFFLLIFIFDWKYVLGLFLLRTLFLYLTYAKATKIFKEKNLLWLLPLQDLTLVLSQISIFIYNSISKPTHWK
ncbi:glycosyltransferase [Mesonia mobilis]|uniref:Glycosyl transferase family 2 n=1 Tax=Mesonia mobilis TaxID=369791 RepID=A0ABQ3C0Y9_9FLAO|nr:glycosyltransferase [Mesonia mobilis]MBQ0738245.1 glycosyltransferase [Aquimarina celericrescens]GGZ64038.1 glycosyl transferase family 2 [Mesonia mobilis]